MPYDVTEVAFGNWLKTTLESDSRRGARKANHHRKLAVRKGVSVKILRRESACFRASKKRNTRAEKPNKLWKESASTGAKRFHATITAGFA
jgi:hypothetical protein